MLMPLGKKEFYKDVYYHRYQLVFARIIHTKNKRSSKPNKNEKKKMLDIINIINGIDKEDLLIIYRDYLGLYTTPYNGLNYYIVPRDYPIDNFKNSVSKYVKSNRKKNTNEFSVPTNFNNNQEGNLFNQGLKEAKINKSQIPIEKKLPESKFNFNSIPQNIEKELIGFSDTEEKNNSQKKITEFLEGNLNPIKTSREVSLTVRNQSIVQVLKERYQHTCQVCQQQLEIGDNEFYSEVHHIQPLGKHDGPDIAENMVVVCPNHHVMFDKGAITIDINLQKVLHIQNSNPINNHPFFQKHNIEEKYIEYHNSNIFKKDNNKPNQETIVDYGDTVLFSDGEEHYEITLENKYNRSLMNNMQRMLLRKKKGEKFAFNGHYYQVIDVIKN